MIKTNNILHNKMKDAYLLLPLSCLLKSISNLIIIFLVIPFFILYLTFIPYHTSFSQGDFQNPSQCNCVVFRMDGLQDYYLQKGQLAPMNVFLTKNQSLTLSLIMNSIGNDTTTINKIREGSYNGLFELAINGGINMDYTKLNQQQQEYLLSIANEKMITFFGNKSNIFIPSMNLFNYATIKAMEKMNLKILSSSLDRENNYDNGKSIFSTVVENSTKFKDKEILHLPSMTSFKYEVNRHTIKNSITNIINNITENIEQYGYAVIALHPQDFMELDKNGEVTDKLNKDEIKDLSNLIDILQSRNIKLISFSEITGVKPMVYPFPPLYMPLFAANSQEILNLKPSDPISLDDLTDLEYAMAETYNRYGKYLEEKASQLGISPSSSAAVLITETKGLGFGIDGKMVIRFEACSFYDIWGIKHPEEFSNYFQCDKPNDKFRSSATDQFAEYHGDHFKEWKVFEFARNLDEEAAMKSISMGLGQIMGFNYDKIGYISVKEMFDSMSNSLTSQLDAFFSALSYKDKYADKSCLDELKSNNYVAFAGCYNASGQDEIYGSKMAQAAKVYQEVISER